MPPRVPWAEALGRCISGGIPADSSSVDDGERDRQRQSALSPSLFISTSFSFSFFLSLFLYLSPCLSVSHSLYSPTSCLNSLRLQFCVLWRPSHFPSGGKYKERRIIELLNWIVVCFVLCLRLPTAQVVFICQWWGGGWWGGGGFRFPPANAWRPRLSRLGPCCQKKIWRGRVEREGLDIEESQRQHERGILNPPPQKKEPTRDKARFN